MFYCWRRISCWPGSTVDVWERKPAEAEGSLLGRLLHLHLQCSLASVHPIQRLPADRVLARLAKCEMDLS